MVSGDRCRLRGGSVTVSASPGHVWFVTGASAGLGRALCECILERGDRLVATARNPATIADLAAHGSDRVAIATLDVTRPTDIKAAVAVAANAFGRIDVLVNNAGYGFVGAVEEASDAEVRAQFEVNFFGLAALTRAVLPMLRAQRAGIVVNISSIAGVRGLAGIGYYCASKWAVEGLSEGLAAECAPLGIRVLIVEPGPFRTEFSGRSIAMSTQVIDDYANARDVRSAVRNMNGRQAGDPARAAALIFETCLADDAPRRIVLGAATYETACRAIEARQSEVRRSAGLAARADYPI